MFITCLKKPNVLRRQQVIIKVYKNVTISLIISNYYS